MFLHLLDWVSPLKKKKKEKNPTMSDEQLLSHASPQHVMP